MQVGRARRRQRIVGERVEGGVMGGGRLVSASKQQGGGSSGIRKKTKKVGRT